MYLSSDSVPSVHKNGANCTAISSSLFTCEFVALKSWWKFYLIVFIILQEKNTAFVHDYFPYWQYALYVCLICYSESYEWLAFVFFDFLILHQKFFNWDMKNSESAFVVSFVFSEWKFLRMIWWLWRGASLSLQLRDHLNCSPAQEWDYLFLLQCWIVGLWKLKHNPSTVHMHFFPYNSVTFFCYFHFVGHTCHSLAANSMFCYWKKICIQGLLVNHNHYVTIRQTFSVE